MNDFSNSGGFSLPRDRMRIKPPISSPMPNFEWTSFEYESKADTCGPCHHIPGLVEQNFHEHLSVTFFLMVSYLNLKKPNKELKEFQSGRSLIANRPESSRNIIACKLLSNWGAQLPNQLSSDMCRALRRGSVGWSALFPGLPMYWCCWSWGQAGPTMQNSGFVDMSSFHLHVCCETALFQNDSYINVYRCINTYY